MDSRTEPQADTAVQDDLDAASVLASLKSYSPPSTFHNNRAFASPAISATTANQLAHLANTDIPSFHEPSTPLPHTSSTLDQSNGAPGRDVEEDSKPDLDDDTAAAIAAATNEHGMRVRKAAPKPADFVETPEIDSVEDTAIAQTKKRPAPADAKKPPMKKRKSEAPSDRDTPVSNRPSSPTPSMLSTKPSKPLGPKKSKSKKPKSNNALQSSNGTNAQDGLPGSEGEADTDDDELYCICRKPDDHNQMFGCDGGCDDWFHGKCVQLSKKDVDIIDKFICPNCQEAGKGVTTWKPMCRRDGCLKPAILKKGSESKYCSKQCGLDFMRAGLKRSAAGQGAAQSRARNKERSAKFGQDTVADGLSVGGAIRPSELKALTHCTTNVDSFRRLGEHPFLTPPPSATPEATPAVEADYTEAEKLRLGEIESRKLLLRQQRLLYKDRETFQAMMKARITPLKEVLKMPGEQLPCGYDPLWALDDISFKEWREGDDGRASFDAGELRIPDDVNDESCTICTRANWAKKRCPQHGNWQPLILRDVRFESTEIGREMRIIDTEERDIQARAMQRAMSKAAHEQQAAEGWVEVVEDGAAVEGLAVVAAKLTAEDEAAGATPSDQGQVPEVKMEDEVRPAYHISAPLDEDTTMTINA